MSLLINRFCAEACSYLIKAADSVCVCVCVVVFVRSFPVEVAPVAAVVVVA